MTPQELAQALGQPKRRGKNWSTICPAHNDHAPSLDITIKDGKLLLICRAGCDQEKVIDALKQRGLWADKPEPPKIVATYNYRDRDGTLKYQVVRQSPKNFYQRRPNGSPEHFVNNMHGVAPLPYHLPEILEDAEATVYLVEGEKDADNLMWAGLLSSCNHGGAGKWRAEISEYFKNRNVVIIPDNDDAGRAHAEDVAQKLAGIAHSIRFVTLENLSTKGDVSDWLANGGSAEKLEELARRSKPLGAPPKPFKAVWADDDAWEEETLPKRPWVAPGYLLSGAVTVLVGPPSAMKSSLMLAWAVALALDQKHGDFNPRVHGPVIVYNVEDDMAEQRRRLSAVLKQFRARPEDIAGKVIRVGPKGVGTLFVQERGTGGQVLSTLAMDELRNIIEHYRPVALIADPLAELHDSEENDNTAMRTVIAAFRSLAVEYDIPVVLLHHTKKGDLVPGDPDSGRGASAIRGAARIILTLSGMSEEDAEILGVPVGRESRANFLRLDDAKQNYAVLGESQWYEKKLETLGNGEIVPAAVPWLPPDMWQALASGTANAILNDIAAGLENGARRYSDAPNAGERAAWQVVQRFAASLSEKQCRAVIQTWLKNEVLYRRSYEDATAHRQTKALGLFVNDAKRPSAVVW